MNGIPTLLRDKALWYLNSSCVLHVTVLSLNNGKAGGKVGLKYWRALQTHTHIYALFLR